SGCAAALVEADHLPLVRAAVVDRLDVAVEARLERVVHRADRRGHAQEIVPDDRARVAEPGDLRAPHRGRWRKCRRCWPSLRRDAAGVDAAEGGPVDSGTRRMDTAAAALLH